MEFYLCRICGEIVNKSHFDSEEHIKNFNSVCDIEIKKSSKNSFISIKCQFFNTNYNYIYTDLYKTVKQSFTLRIVSCSCCCNHQECLLKIHSHVDKYISTQQTV